MSNAVAKIEPPQAPPRALVAGSRVQAIVPQSMEDAYRIAKAVVAANMAPKGMATAEACMVAIMHGMEVGLTPMAALQRIAVVNGRPTIWGDGAVGLVRASGLCEHIRERLEGDGDNLAAICEAKRRGEAEPIISRFSVGDAKRAGLWGKQGPWQQYPRRMLQMRARAFALRDGFADVLGGLYLREEIEETERTSAAPPPQAPRIEALRADQETIYAADEPAATQSQEPPPVKAPPVAPSVNGAPAHVDAEEIRSPDEVLAELENVVSGITDEADLDAVWSEYQKDKALAFPGDKSRAQAIIAKHRETITS